MNEAERVLELTQQGKIKWRKTDSGGVYEANVENLKLSSMYDFRNYRLILKHNLEVGTYVRYDDYSLIMQNEKVNWEFHYTEISDLFNQVGSTHLTHSTVWEHQGSSIHKLEITVDSFKVVCELWGIAHATAS